MVTTLQLRHAHGFTCCILNKTGKLLLFLVDIPKGFVEISYGVLVSMDLLLSGTARPSLVGRIQPFLYSCAQIIRGNNAWGAIISQYAPPPDCYTAYSGYFSRGKMWPCTRKPTIIMWAKLIFRYGAWQQKHEDVVEFRFFRSKCAIGRICLCSLYRWKPFVLAKTVLYI